MAEIIPSWLSTRPVGGDTGYDPFRNTLLRHGEVVGVTHPEESASLSKRFTEYDVLVQHWENGTASNRLYQHCFLANPVAGFADKEVWSLRVDDSQKTGSVLLEPGNGSKVLVLCLSGQQHQAVILGGIRDDRDSDRGAAGRKVYWERVFNGVASTVKDDGSASVERRGPTTPKGEFDSARGKSDDAGARVEIAADGGITAATPGGDQRVELSHQDHAVKVTARSKVSIVGQDEVVVDSGAINLGAGAKNSAAKGDELVGVLGDLIDAITSLTVAIPGTGTSGPPINSAQFIAIRARLSTIKSTLVKLKA